MINVKGGADVNCSAPAIVAELNTFCGHYPFGHESIALRNLGGCRFTSSNPTGQEVQVAYLTHGGSCFHKLAINGRLAVNDPWIFDPVNGSHDFIFELFPNDFRY